MNLTTATNEQLLVAAWEHDAPVEIRWSALREYNRRKDMVHGKIEFDKNGMMKYHPDFHPNHRKNFTLEELEYLCKFYEVDGVRVMSMALGKTERVVAAKVNTLRNRGMFNYYKNLNKYY